MCAKCSKNYCHAVWNYIVWKHGCDLWDFKFSLWRVWSSESSGMYCRVLNWMLTDVSEAAHTSETSVNIQLRTWQYIIRALMMEAACTSETSVSIQLRTRQYIPEDSELHGSDLCNKNINKCYSFQIRKVFWKVISHYASSLSLKIKILFPVEVNCCRLCQEVYLSL
jgi:hypothetical protein